MGQIRIKGYTPQRLPDGSFPKYVYGIGGIAELFGVSTVTAGRYKKTFLGDAVTQRGKIIITDTEKAMAKFNEKKKGA